MKTTVRRKFGSRIDGERHQQPALEVDRSCPHCAHVAGWASSSAPSAGRRPRRGILAHHVGVAVEHRARIVQKVLRAQALVGQARPAQAGVVIWAPGSGRTA